jgi:phospholipid/cholesterol/gamma-HCH transport system substrate-binding protein
MKFFTKEVQIALVAIVGLVILFFGMKFLKGLSMLSEGNTYMVKFADVSGLSASSPVYVNGVKVGTVESIDCDYSRPDQIVAAVGLDESLMLPVGTTAEIASDLLGNVKLELHLGDMSAGRMAVGDTIFGGMQSGLMSKAAGMLPQIQQMLPKLDSILASVNALLADPTLNRSLHNVEDITAGLTKTTAELNTLTASLNRQLPGIMGKADGVMANADTLTHTLNTLDLAGTMAKVNQTLQNVERMTAQLNSNEGTLGLLMRDPELYNNLNATMMHADSLMIDLKSHPKRYVHFSVFGKKDK